MQLTTSTLCNCGDKKGRWHKYYNAFVSLKGKLKSWELCLNVKKSTSPTIHIDMVNFTSPLNTRSKVKYRKDWTGLNWHKKSVHIPGPLLWGMSLSEWIDSITDFLPASIIQEERLLELENHRLVTRLDEKASRLVHQSMLLSPTVQITKKIL